MTLSTLTNRVVFTGNGVTTSFAHSFKIWAASNLKVYLRDNASLIDTLLTYTTHYSSDIVSFPNTGNVLMVTAPAVGKSLVIVRDMPFTQELDLIASGAFAAENMEIQLDKIVGQIQTLADDITYLPATGLPSPRGTVYDTAITQAPASFGNHDSILTAFSGDLSKVFFPVKHNITGAATAGQPATGYTYTPEIYPHYTYVYSDSGHNQELGSNVGRTGIAAYRTNVFQDGQGDLVCFNAAGFVRSTKAGSTLFTANPAVVLFNGNLSTGVAGAFLNAYEVSLDDAGFDCAGIGAVYNLERTITTGAKGVYWAGVRIQSMGAAAVDVMYSGIGPANFGLDFSFANFGANKAAIALKADDRIYFDVDPTDATGLSRFPAIGDTYAAYDTALTALKFVVNAGQILAMTSTGLGMFGTTPVAARSGWGVATGTPTRTTFATGSVTLPQLAERVKALIDDLHQTAGYGFLRT